MCMEIYTFENLEKATSLSGDYLVCQGFVAFCLNWYKLLTNLTCISFFSLVSLTSLSVADYSWYVLPTQ